MLRILKKQSPSRLIALGFALAILLGSGLLMLPCSLREGVSLRYVDALYTSTSAVCVTGLIAADAGDTFSPLGQLFIAAMIQIGGLGVTAIGAGLILAVGRKLDFKGRNLLREAMNLESGGGAVAFLKRLFLITLVVELAGTGLSYISFSRTYPPLKALGVSAFHAIAAFNNAGFDILGGFTNLIPYQKDVLLTLVTAALIILGGLGFLVIHELLTKRFRWRRLSLHARVVLSMSGVLLLGGTLLFRLTEQIPWLGAFFTSVTTRTAGFSTYSVGEFSRLGLLIVCVFMVIGACPGSTGGGIKTSTVFVLFQGIRAAATNQREQCFHYTLPVGAFRKAATITLLAILIILAATMLLLALEPTLELEDALFEMTSAFGTVGLSTGITPGLGIPAKLLSMVIMFIGRLGPLTIVTLWRFTEPERVGYPEGSLAIG